MKLTAHGVMTCLAVYFLSVGIVLGEDFSNFQMKNPAVDIRLLEINGEAAVSESVFGREYIFDASTVVSVPAEKLLASALDYSRYPEMGMPHLSATEVVEVSGESLWVWNQMTYAGFNTSYYLEVQRYGRLGIVWSRIDKRDHWPYEEKVILDKLSGSFYLEPLADGTTYLRYVMIVRPKYWIPKVLIDQFIRTQSAEGIRTVIKALLNDASYNNASYNNRSTSLAISALNRS